MNNIQSHQLQLQLTETFTKTVFTGIFIFHIIMPVILSFIFHSYSNPLDTALYLLLNATLFIVRFILNKKLIVACRVNIESIHNITSIIAVVIIVSAFVHLYAFAHIFSAISESQVVLVIAVLVIIVAGAITTVGMIYKLFIVFIISNLIPISILFIYHGGESNYYIATALLLYASVALNSAYKYYTTIKESIRLKNSFKHKVKEATSKLENQNELLNDMLEISMSMVIFYDKNGVVVYVNKTLSEKFGYSEEECIGKNIFSFLTKESIPVVMEALKEKKSVPYEIQAVREDSTLFHILVSGKNTIFNGEEIRMATMLDLTEVKEKDQLIYHQSKLAQMGEMISMIAHQWRQPLSAISSASMALNIKSQIGTIENNDIINTTDDISKYSQHLSETIEDFRNFFKPNKQIALTNYNDILKTVLLIIEQSIVAKGITISLDLQAKEEFNSFSSEIKQVVLNIIKNAEDALIDNKIEDGFIKISTYIEEDSNLKYILEVRDNAGGIPSDIIDKVFEPYFSTKLEKNGTGLGLYMSKMIIEEHCHGKLEAQNIEDGTVLRISLKEIVLL